MYKFGYKFKTHAQVDPKSKTRELLPFYLYDRAWDHTKSPAENEAERQHVLELKDGQEVEVVSNQNGALFVKTDGGEGFLG